MRASRLAAFLSCSLLLNAAMGEEGASSDEDFIGGPTSVGSQLQSDSRAPEEESAHSWLEFKASNLSVLAPASREGIKYLYKNGD